MYIQRAPIEHQKLSVPTESGAGEVGRRDNHEPVIEDEEFGMGEKVAPRSPSNVDPGGSQLHGHANRLVSHAKRVMFEHHEDTDALGGCPFQRVNHTGIGQDVAFDEDVIQGLIDCSGEWSYSLVRFQDELGRNDPRPYATIGVDG